MFSLRSKGIRLLTSAALLTTGIGLLSVFNAASSAHADPGYTNVVGQHQYVGVGSDTIQDLFNAFAGEEPTAGQEPTEAAAFTGNPFYTPLATQNSTAPYETIASFNATNPHANYPGTSDPGDYITTRLGGATFDRPNGSGDGRAALDASVNSGNFSNANGPAEPVGGQIDFARASSLGNETLCASFPCTPTGDLTAIPFAADGVAYAYHCGSAPTSADCKDLAELAKTDMFNLYNGNGQSAAGTWGPNPGTTTQQLDACAIQPGSGTFKFFLSQIGTSITEAQEQTNDINSTCVGVEENNLDSFLTDAAAGSATADWIIPVSTGNVIAQHNGAALDVSNNFWNTNGTDIGGQGLAPLSNDFATTVQTAATAGTSSIVIGLQAPAGSTININPGGGDAETAVVTSVSGNAPDYTETLSAPLANNHAVSEPVTITFTFPYNGDGTATWTPNTAYYAGLLGRWLFIIAPSKKITGLGIDHGLADLFYTPKATGGNAQICTSAAQALDSKFGFDPSLPDDVKYQANPAGINSNTNNPCGEAYYTDGTN